MSKKIRNFAAVSIAKVARLYRKMSKELYIQQHANLFWYTPTGKKKDISDALLVETILNYGTLEDYRGLLAILTPQRVAEVFFSADERQQNNYFPIIRNFFSIVLKQYA